MTYWSDHQAKAALIHWGHRLYSRGLVAGGDGNLSIKVSPTTLWTTPSGVCKGFLTEDMLVKVNLEGEVLEGSRRPSSELPLHLRLYQELPAIQAVVHAHPPAATAFAAAQIPLTAPILSESVLQLGEVPVVPYALPGSSALPDLVAAPCHTARALLLAFHGAVTWGENPNHAMDRMECLEQFATVSLHLKTLGVSR